MNVSFEAFFESVWGFEPYPWQVALSKLVREEGWPGVIDVPTGAGKTAVLDIALHHFATTETTRAPRRMIVVVDRRVIVDQVGFRAHQIRDALMDAEKARDPHRKILGEMRSRLESVSGKGAPLIHTEVLRGGSVRRDAWAAYPHVPVLAASTVDQVGSRLLFRGYGVGDRMRPIHAGLLGCDTIFFLDEVHLARPFADVLDQLDRLREATGTGEIPRLRVVQLSATPGKAFTPATTVFRLSQADRENERLARILAAQKPATLELTKVRVRSSEAVKRLVMAEAAALRAREMVAEGRKAVAVVVNRVDTARRTWTLLQDGPFDTVLLTGRMRPLDQVAAVRRIEPRIMAGRVPDPDALPMIVVATQCIEAGADYDFDGLVTEAASLDALRQRFGRLDRRGEYELRASVSTSIAARGVVLARSDLVGSNDDPVYGSSLRDTWEWLSGISSDGIVDFGISALQPQIDGAADRMSDLNSQSRPAPVMLPAYLDQWAQTNPKPHADPDVALFLHGIPEDARAAVPDVQVVWRADVTEEELSSGPEKRHAVLDHLAMVPPGSLEAISLPVWTLRRWLSGVEDSDADDDVADVEGVRSTAEERKGPARPVVFWRGRDRSDVVPANAVPPGALIVVPASYGGIGVHGTFDPGAPAFSEADAFIDYGDLVQLRQRERATLRLDKRVLAPLEITGVEELLPDPRDDEADLQKLLREALAVIRANADSKAPDWVAELLDAVGEKPRFVLSPMDGWIALGRRRREGSGSTRLSLVAGDAAGAIESLPEEEESENFTGDQSPSPLPEHLEGVGDLAAEYAKRIGLAANLIAALRWSGRLHDIGKVDPRFQLWLYGGDEIAATFGPVIAKSAIFAQDMAGRRNARRRAGYPQGQRHELVSLDMVERSRELRARVEDSGVDWDLVLHLIGAHHGWCRPLAPIVELAPEQGDEVTFSLDGVDLTGSTAHARGRLDAGIIRRFWAMSRKYGMHELAYLEAILRLADHRRSAEESES